MATTRTRRRPSRLTAEQRAERAARRYADKQAAIAARENGAALLASRPELIDAFRVYASRVMGHRTLGNALGMMAQRPDAIRVNSAFFWAKEGRRVLPEAKPMCVLARRKGNRIVERENPQTGEVEETIEGKWTGWTAERVFDVRDTVPKESCPLCGGEAGERCPDTCPVYEPVAGPLPSREEVADLLDKILKDDGGFDLDFAETARDETAYLEVDE